MKRRIMALLMAMVMVLGMGVISHAEVDEVRYFEGTAGEILEGEYSEVLNKAWMEYSSNYISFSFLTKDLKHNLLLIPIEGSENESGQVKCTVIYDGTEKGVYYHYYDVFSILDDTVTWIKIGCDDIYLSGELNLVEFFPDKGIHEISTPFTGTAVSDREEYTLALAGYFEKQLTDGTHELTLEEISTQTISIVAYNKENGVKRVMTQSTIEEMSVTVSNGVVTEYTIRGRVQTSGGKLDRYTAVISN